MPSALYKQATAWHGSAAALLARASVRSSLAARASPNFNAGAAELVGAAGHQEGVLYFPLACQRKARHRSWFLSISSPTPDDILRRRWSSYFLLLLLCCLLLPFSRKARQHQALVCRNVRRVRRGDEKAQHLLSKMDARLPAGGRRGRCSSNAMR